MKQLFPNIFDDLDPANVDDPLFHALEKAWHLVSHQTYYWDEIENTAEYFKKEMPIWLQYADRSPFIRLALEFIRRHEEHTEVKRIAKETKDAKRKEVASNYDAIFMAIGRRDGFYCKLCGLSPQDLQVDHIIPLSLGGSNDSDNLQLLCKSCNCSKGNRV